MADNGLTGEDADRIYRMIQAFAGFGFAESHSLSFALLVYASSWLKLHYPASYLTGMLRAWPMGFYSPATLVSDAERHGVEVRRPCVQRSAATAHLEPLHTAQQTAPTGRDECLIFDQPPPGEFDPSSPDDSAEHRRDGAYAVRLGLASIDGIGMDTAEAIVEQRERGGPFGDIYNLARRVGLREKHLEALADAGALADVGVGRREGLWLAGSAATARPSISRAATAPSTSPCSSR